jgi:DtxR family Mn-dependent transcriptional regulator
MNDLLLLITLSLFGLLAAAIFFWPGQGLLAHWRANQKIRARAQIEDALKHIHAMNERGDGASPESLAGALKLSVKASVELIEQAQRAELVESTEHGLRLTSAGNDWALHVIRAHRLWERHLADQASWPLADLHAEADRREHTTSPAELAAMEADLGYPRRDPHGDPIPTESGELSGNHYPPLTQWPLNTPGRIAHLEDEPAEVFAQILAEGLKPGMPVRVIESSPGRIVFETRDTQHVLAPIVAANISIEAIPQPEPQPGQALTTLHLGQQAQILALADTCQGLTRRRFLDLGLTPGATIEVALPNAFNDPMAYRVRGTLIALRHEQANQIIINPQTITQGD